MALIIFHILRPVPDLVTFKKRAHPHLFLSNLLSHQVCALLPDFVGTQFA